MKKILVGLGVIVVFVAYSLWVRHEQPVVRATSTPSLTTQTSNSSSQNNGGSSSGNSTSPATYKDGTYTGSTEDASYGNVQVAAVITGGKLTDVNVLQYPDSHSDSIAINQQALPMLKQESIQAQSANVDIISGATFTSEAFAQSLRNALVQAQNS